MKEVSGWRPPVAATEVHRPSLGQRLLGALALALISPIAVGMAAAAFVLLPQDLASALILALIATLSALLVGYVARDTYAKWTLRAEFGPKSVALRLPAGRSLIHQLPAFDGVIPYADIAAVEMRLEAYRSVGLAAMQRAYGLRLRDGALIILGEDRALSTNFAQLGASHWPRHWRRALKWRSPISAWSRGAVGFSWSRALRLNRGAHLVWGRARKCACCVG